MFVPAGLKSCIHYTILLLLVHSALPFKACRKHLQTKALKVCWLAMYMSYDCNCLAIALTRRSGEVHLMSQTRRHDRHFEYEPQSVHM